MVKYVGFLLLCLMLLPSPAPAQNELESYFQHKQRDAALLQQNAVHLSDAQLAKQTSSDMADLQRILRKLVGPWRIAGFATQGTINYQYLGDDLGSDALDGLAASSVDGSMQAIVSTPGLLEGWLHIQQRSRPEFAAFGKANLWSLFASEAFYSGAFDRDAYFYKYADLPLDNVSGAMHAHAALFFVAQDYPSPRPPNLIAVSLLYGNQIFVLTAPVRVAQIPLCATAFALDTAKAEVALAAYRKSGLHNAADFDRYSQLDDQADRNYRACFQHQLSQQPGYAQLLQQARALMARVGH